MKTHSRPYPFIESEAYRDSLRDQVALITGAGRGIGRSLAIAFANAGASVACVSRTLAEVEAVADEIRAGCDVTAMAVRADIAQAEVPREVIAEVEASLGPIDILVNNAAISKINTLEHEKDFDSWWYVIETNLRGPVAMTHALLPGMLQRKRGTIISIASRCGTENVPYTSAYSASKAALIRFHHGLALELSSNNVFTFIVQPGNVPTTLSKRPGVIDAETLGKVPGMRKMLENTIGTCTEAPELMANTAVMLAANKRAAVLNGMCINAQNDMEILIEEAEQGSKSRIAKEKLYMLKVDEL